MPSPVTASSQSGCASSSSPASAIPHRSAWKRLALPVRSAVPSGMPSGRSAQPIAPPASCIASPGPGRGGPPAQLRDQGLVRRTASCARCRRRGSRRGCSRPAPSPPSRYSDAQDPSARRRRPASDRPPRPGRAGRRRRGPWPPRSSPTGRAGPAGTTAVRRRVPAGRRSRPRCRAAGRRSGPRAARAASPAGPVSAPQRSAPRRGRRRRQRRNAGPACRRRRRGSCRTAGRAALGGPREPRPLREVPDQQPVVGADQRRVGVHADGALEPPERGVQGVGVVAGAGHQAGSGEPGAQHVGAVDADVPALVGVVLVRQRPADPLRPVAGTVTATRPPGLSTRKISAIAVASSGMCSSTSDAMTRSTLASGKGRCSRSPDDLVASAGRRLAGLGDRTQPALRRRHLGYPQSTAITDAPRRTASKACRPSPQPRSSRVMPACTPSRS